jgi:hypothetical protein
LAGASSSVSDRFEELLVNPAIIELARRRGEIDCGGLRYVIVAYGNFFQLVIPLTGGHASIAIERDASVADVLPHVSRVLSAHSFDHRT